MTRLRLLVWLIAMVALIASPGLTLHAAAVSAPAMADCPDHPPPPCPDAGTAKHAASTCCPLMAGAVALLSQSPEIGASSHVVPVAASVRSLAGRTFSQDPPPPRV